MRELPLPWLYLLAAGFLEIGWLYSLKFTEGFTRFLPTCFYALFGVGAAFFLSLALKYICSMCFAIRVSQRAMDSELLQDLHGFLSLQIASLPIAPLRSMGDQ